MPITKPCDGCGTPITRKYPRYMPEHPLAQKNGYVFEHRRVVHDAGIEIPTGHHVHHRNEDRMDNRLENLEVLSPSDHSKHTRRSTVDRIAQLQAELSEYRRRFGPLDPPLG